MKDSWSFSNQYIVTIVACPFIMQYFKDGPLEKLWGGGGRGQSTKKKRQLILKNIHALA